ncbi:hypothetical protein M153_25157000146 [Pseudoloma neurophilia]|uniref:Uncharacterized protein n=1 Tax=Pseudoloma neurophilia TaxID=146866 RepID=A0A0R0LQN9_9MICR|nr:hypothetical protein M153_25157000146 [Pseudoloma neurophilia]
MFLFYLVAIFADNSGLEKIFGQKIFSFKNISPVKWKNAKVNKKEEEENQKILDKIMAMPGKKALNQLVSDIKKFNKEEEQDKIDGKDKFNTVCWLWGMEKCHKDEPESKLDNDNPKNIFTTEKHFAFLNRKLQI